MAVYKVIQDIEAEDKLLGPLTLKGFIYAAVAGVLTFLCVRLAISGIGDFKWAFIILALPPIILFGLLAAPIGKDQPTEVWLLSHLRFFLKPKVRIWDQSGPSYTVTITAPKKVERQLTKNLSQDEVKSRLKALTATLDSRGWALKNVDVNSAPPAYFQQVSASSDRLIPPSATAGQSPVLDIHAQDDIMDPSSNSTAQHVDQLMQEADTQRKKQLQDNLETVRLQSSRGQTPITNIRDEVSHKKIDKRSRSDRQNQTKSSTAQAPNPVTTAYAADKIALAESGNAFSVATLSRMANRHEPTVERVGPNEVVINLH